MALTTYLALSGLFVIDPLSQGFTLCYGIVALSGLDVSMEEIISWYKLVS